MTELFPIYHYIIVYHDADGSEKKLGLDDTHIDTALYRARQILGQLNIISVTQHDR